MILEQMAGVKINYANIDATHATAVSLSTASILGPIQTLPRCVGILVLEHQLGNDATTGAPHKIIGAAAEIDNATGIISVTIRFSAVITRTVRVAIITRD